jgi:hypothetical protein
MFRHISLALLIAVGATAFVTSPFGGIHKSTLLPSKHLISFSEVNGVNEAPEATSSITDEVSVSEANEAPEATSSITDEVSVPEVAAESGEAKPKKVIKGDRFTAFVGNLPFCTFCSVYDHLLYLNCETYNLNSFVN